MTPPSKPEKPAVRLADRLALRPREAAAALGLSERTFRSLLPSVPHLREKGAVLIPTDLLREWLRDRAKVRERRLDELETEFSARIAQGDPE